MRKLGDEVWSLHLSEAFRVSDNVSLTDTNLENAR